MSIDACANPCIYKSVYLSPTGQSRRPRGDSVGLANNCRCIYAFAFLHICLDCLVNMLCTIADRDVSVIADANCLVQSRDTARENLKRLPRNRTVIVYIACSILYLIPFLSFSL